MHRSFFVGLVLAFALSPAAAQQQIDFEKAQVTTKDMGRGLHLLLSTGDNLFFVEGPNGVLLVDTNWAQMIDKITAAIAKTTGKPVKLVINMHAHPDHLGGNEVLGKTGALIIASENTRKHMTSGMTFFGQTIPPYPQPALPSLTVSDATIYFGGETIRLIRAPSAHTDSDLMIYFEEANVAHIGGVFGNSMGYPLFDRANGGSIDGIIAGQAKLLSIVDDKTALYSDQGRAFNKKDLQESHDLLVIVRDRIQRLIDAGKSEDEAVAAKPTREFDKQWAPKGTFLTGDFLTRQIYESLKAAPAASATPQ